MFRFSLRKMFKNRWLTLSLLAGYIIAVAIVSSMPAYSHAILARMLRKDLEQSQLTSGIYPGQVLTEIKLNTMQNDPAAKISAYEDYANIYYNEFLFQLGLPIQEDVCYRAASSVRIVRQGTDEEIAQKQFEQGGLGCCEGLFDHITLLDGRLPADKAADGVVEVVVSEKASKQLGCALGSSYDIYYYVYGNKAANGQPYTFLTTVKVVGVYAAADPSDLFWVMPENTFADALLMSPALFEELFVSGEKSAFNHAQWAAAVDYTAMTPENCAAISELATSFFDAKAFSPKIRSAFRTILPQYVERRQQLAQTLWIIQVPILLLLLLYLFMVSRLILSHEKNEIAVLQSRGSSKMQVMGVYLSQAAVLAAVALFAGPFLGLLFCRLIGASNGFMEFVNRRALPVELTADAVKYAVLVSVLLVATMLLAVATNGDTSIVSLKRKKSGKAPKPLWQRLFLDLVALLLSLYGLYSFKNRLEVVRQAGVPASDIPIDFMLYISSTLFILGGTLCFLRLFPLVVRLVYQLGRRFWGPVPYLSMLSAARQGGKNQMISLFLVFTLSTGVFNSVAVRTLNQMEEDRIRYITGADVVLEEEWPSVGGGGDPAMGEDASESPVYYTEPQFSKYEALPSVESAARVLTIKKASISYQSKKKNGVTLMGIVPDEFGRTCFFKNSLLPHHLNEYLNLMAEDPRALLLSQSFLKESGLVPGDTVFLSIGGNRSNVQFTVYAGVDYFPSFNPADNSGRTEPLLAVANLIYLQQETKLEPYAVWLKKAPGATSSQLYEELAGFSILQLSDASVQLTAAKNDPLTQGINGYFTLSFLVTMLITFVGFFLYWILAIKSRLLQFGILRSMGLSRLSVTAVLLWEQLLASAMSIAAGFGLGVLAAELFAPVLECNVSAADQILPFTVTAFPGDFVRMAVLVSAMLLLAAAALGRIVFTLHAGEALKLGEE